MRARAVLVVALSLTAAAPALARRRAAAAEGIDDPKLARRLGTRVWLPGAPSAAAQTTSPAAQDALIVEADPPREAETRPAGPGAAGGERVPRIKLGFRRFDFVRVGATDAGSTTGNAASEPFDSLSLDIYPLSSLVRFGLSTQYGWQEGAFMSSGDYFLAQSFSLGGQLPGRTVTPFAEGFFGGGYMRRLQFDRTIPTVYWQLGIDAGAEVFLAKHGFVSFALGYLHPVNGFATAQSTGSTATASFTTVFVDTWSFKLGLGF